ncbi:hypothetical protein LEP1GSC058_2474 [Leptospira fainei serovar Hurstbridge str. BUT 6]|uniref:Fibronectin type-III domain-containing protein n=1 Tax=Leptospira fainei serovar Hurstbridge str. BUT 6 TaxID=1193011 RepID=S3V921_9LEPT|nr:hypothetical protein [Leptospira fainei]EPG72915.1 hypothetical protein LEP1GSC058_2474 [Leptospira fainei serovar Hurstbridge str. BUT 6]
MGFLLSALLGNNNQATQPTAIPSSPVLDTTPPVPGGAGVITVTPSGVYSASTKAQVNLSWTVGTDNVSLPANLTYQAYYSTSNNITTLSTTLANGTPFGSVQTNLSNINVNQLFGNTAYYFNVVIADPAGNQSVYVSNSSTTLTAAYLFDSTSNSTGNVASRANVNNLCTARLTSMSANTYPWKNNCSTVVAFISLSGVDTIANLLVPVSGSAIILGSQGMILASNSGALMGGTIQNTIRNAIPEYSSGAGWWSFSTVNGGYAAVDSCSNGTSNSAAVSGRIGFPDITSSSWLDYAINGEGAPSGATCDIQRAIFCLCY